MNNQHTIPPYHIHNPGILRSQDIVDITIPTLKQQNHSNNTSRINQPLKSTISRRHKPQHNHSTIYTNSLAPYSQFNHQSFQQQNHHPNNHFNPQQQQWNPSHRSYPKSNQPYYPANTSNIPFPNKSATSGGPKINSAYHSIAPPPITPQNKYSNETYYGKLRNDYSSGGSPSDNYYTQSYTAGKSKYPLIKTITNPFTTMYQRIKFILLPRDNEHKNRKPFNVPIERYLNRCYQRYHTWSFTHVASNKRLLKVIKYPLIIVGTIGGFLYFKHEKPLVQKTAVYPQDREYTPEHPQQHLPFRSALLPHTLPSQLSGKDSHFVNDYLDGSSETRQNRRKRTGSSENHDQYDTSQIIRPEELRRFERPSYAYGRKSVGLYGAAVSGWGHDKKLYDAESRVRKPLVDDVPKPIDTLDVYSTEHVLSEDELSISAKYSFHQNFPEEELLGRESIVLPPNHPDLTLADRKARTKGQFSTRDSYNTQYRVDPYGEWSRPPGTS